MKTGLVSISSCSWLTISSLVKHLLDGDIVDFHDPLFVLRDVNMSLQSNSKCLGLSTLDPGKTNAWVAICVQML